MLRARSRGRLMQGEADYQLHVIYLWYERQPRRALELLHALQARYPANPLYLAQIAHVQDAYEHDVTASLETWRTLLAAAREQRANNAALAEVQARLGAARMLEAMHLTDDAIEHLRAATALKSKEPYSTLALAFLKLGQAHDRMGARPAAMAAYKSAVAAVPPLDPYDVRGQTVEHMRRAPDSRRAEAYRLSLDGWRRLERNDVPGATTALERSLALAPDDPVARYRYGRLLQTRRLDAAALEQYNTAIRRASHCPAPVLGNVYLEVRAAARAVRPAASSPSPPTRSRRRCSAPPPIPAPPRRGRWRGSARAESSARLCAAQHAALTDARARFSPRSHRVLTNLTTLHILSLCPTGRMRSRPTNSLCVFLTS